MTRKYNSLGKIHELLVYRNLSNDQIYNEKLVEHLKQMSGRESELCQLKAYDATNFIKTLFKRETINSVQLTDDDHSTVADLVLHVSNENLGWFIGISLKVTNCKNPTYISNPGSKWFCEATGIDSLSSYEAAKTAVYQKWPELATISVKALKELIKSNNEIQVVTSRVGDAVLKDFTATQALGLKRLPKKDLADFIKTRIIQGMEEEVIEVTTLLIKEKIVTKARHLATRYEQQLSDYNNLDLEYSGNYIYFKYNNEKFADVRLKYKSRFGSYIAGVARGY